MLCTWILLPIWFTAYLGLQDTVPPLQFPGRSRRKGEGRRNARCSHTGSAMLPPPPRRAHPSLLHTIPFTQWRTCACRRTLEPTLRIAGWQRKNTVVVVWYFDQTEAHPFGLAWSIKKCYWAIRGSLNEHHPSRDRQGVLMVETAMTYSPG